MAVTPFGSRLHAALRARGPVCIGIDPHPGLLRAWGLADDVAGLERFARTVVDALADRVAVLKPQSAFFERHGSAGIAVLETVVAEARAAGALVLMDAKRGDIGSTVAAYADAYLNPSSPLAADAVTATPYLGFGSLRPMIDTARSYGRGVFVVTLTSNPEGATVQHARTADGRTVAQHVLDAAGELNAGAVPLGSVGVVIGATISDVGHVLTNLNGPFLAPGLGAQGGRPDDLRRIFGHQLDAVIPSYSRQVLQKGPDIGALRNAADTVRNQCVRVLDRPR